MAVKGILQINDILNEYSRDIQNGIEDIAKDVAKDDAKKLRDTRNTYKVRSGNYNKGWTYKNDKKGRYAFNYVVHNKDNYQLTHLLEKGHRIIGRDGSVKGQTKAFPHIAPVEQESNKEYEQRVENLIKNGG